MRSDTGRALYRRGRIALKECPAHLVLEVDVPDGESGSDANCFMILVDYLSGCNSSHQAVVLQAPVGQVEDDAWLLTEKNAANDKPVRKAIRFDFSNDPCLGLLPEPTDPRVHLRSIPSSRHATIWFAGEPSDERVALQSNQLRDFIALKELMPLASGNPVGVRASRCGPFRLLTELSIPIADWSSGKRRRMSSPSTRLPVQRVSRAVMMP